MALTKRTPGRMHRMNANFVVIGHWPQMAKRPEYYKDLTPD